jgi:predicted nucleotidyltransferase component of viral defense system
LTVSEVYEAELLRRLQQKIRGGMVWKGGTVLRLEGSERFSRDLDATRRAASLTTQRIIGALKGAKEKLPYLAGLGIKPQPQSIVAEYRFSIPGLQQPLRIRVAIALRERVLRTPAPISTARMAHPVGLEPVIVARLESTELLAEKVRALVMRRAGRDIYDVYWLLQRSVEFDPRLFLHKMYYYERIGKPVDPIEKMERTIKELEASNPSRAKTELANLFPAAQRNLDFAVILEDVLRALKSWVSLVSSANPRKGKRARKA